MHTALWQYCASHPAIPGIRMFPRPMAGTQRTSLPPARAFAHNRMMKKAIGAAALFAFFGLSVAPVVAAPLEIPFDFSRMVPGFEISIKGKPFQAILDAYRRSRDQGSPLCRLRGSRVEHGSAFRPRSA